MKFYIKRVAPSNNRVTAGKIYEKNAKGYIIDDKGQLMRASPEEWLNVDTNTEEELSQPMEEGRKMKASKITIKEAILINDQDAANVPQNVLIDMLFGQENLVEKLSSLKAKSKAIDNLIKQHKDNIVKLVEILDSRE